MDLGNMIIDRIVEEKFIPDMCLTNMFVISGDLGNTTMLNNLDSTAVGDLDNMSLKEI